MIKQAEINAAYQQGVHAALIKLAAPPGNMEKLWENQKGVAANIGLGGQGLTRNQALMPDALGADATDDAKAEQLAAIAELMKTKGHAAYNPMNYATMENLSRAGMLGGAGAGAYLGGMDPRAAAMASAGALGGGMIGGNLGQGLGMAYDAYQGKDTSKHLTDDRMRQLMAGGGALGGAAGGVGAGLYG